MTRRRCRIERATFGSELEEAASRFDGVAAVLPSRPSAVGEPFRCPRSRARPAVHPTTAFPPNRWRSTRPPALRSCLRAAARRGEEVSRRVAVLQTAAPDGFFVDGVGVRLVHSRSPASFSSTPRSRSSRRCRSAWTRQDGRQCRWFLRVGTYVRPHPGHHGVVVTPCNGLEARSAGG